MAAIDVDPSRVHEFADGDAFHAWLSQHHDREPEVWIKIHKVGSGLASITPKQAIDAVLCWGWIDGVRKSFDEVSFVQRITPRPFDPYPFILLNLGLSCIAAVQAPIILMSQNRQNQKDRLNAAADYEVNMKAEMEILALHEKLDELREKAWRDLIEMQQRQLALLQKLEGAAAR